MPTDAYTIITVVRLDAAVNSAIVDGNSGDAGRLNITFTSNGSVRLDHGFGVGSDVAKPAAQVATDGTEWAILLGSYSQAAGTAALGKNSKTVISHDVFAGTHSVGRVIYVV